MQPLPQRRLTPRERKFISVSYLVPSQPSGIFPTAPAAQIPDFAEAVELREGCRIRANRRDQIVHQIVLGISLPGDVSGVVRITAVAPASQYDI